MVSPNGKTATPPAEEFVPSNPALCDVMERNIQTLYRLRESASASQSTQDRIADSITSFSGNMGFVYLHAVWFGIWIVLNTGHTGIKAFDPFPYGLLTMIVSLEAIFLSTFVLLSQNRLAEVQDRRAELDLQIGLLTEHEVTRVLQMLDAIQERLGIENDADSELAQLETETRPEDVLEELTRVQREARATAGRFKKK